MNLKWIHYYQCCLNEHHVDWGSFLNRCNLLMYDELYLNRRGCSSLGARRIQKGVWEVWSQCGKIRMGGDLLWNGREKATTQEDNNSQILAMISRAAGMHTERVRIVAVYWQKTETIHQRVRKRRCWKKIGADWERIALWCVKIRYWLRTCWKNNLWGRLIVTKDRDKKQPEAMAQTDPDLFQREQCRAVLASQERDLSGNGPQQLEMTGIETTRKNSLFLSWLAKVRVEVVKDQPKSWGYSHRMSLPGHRAPLELLPLIVAHTAHSSLPSISEAGCLGLWRVYSTVRRAKKKEEKMLSSTTDTAQK